MKPNQAFKSFYCDTETTGLDADVNELVQFACIVEVDNEIIEELEFKVRPHKLKAIEPKALAAQGKTLEELLAYPPRQEGWAQLAELLDRHDISTGKLIWTGQNPMFDRRFTSAFAKEHNCYTFEGHFDWRCLDLIQLAMVMRQRGFFKPKSFKQTDMAAELGIEYRAHDALEDVRVMRQIMHTFMGWIQGPSRFGKQLDLI